jgi:hypothetical protein
VPQSSVDCGCHALAWGRCSARINYGYRVWGRGSATLGPGAGAVPHSSVVDHWCPAVTLKQSIGHYGAGSVPHSVLGLHSVRLLLRCHARVWGGELTHPRHLLHPPAHTPHPFATPPPHTPHSRSVPGRRRPWGRRARGRGTRRPRRWRAGRTARWVVKYGSACRCHARVWARGSALIECGPSALVCVCVKHADAALDHGPALYATAVTCHTPLWRV